MCGYQHIDRLFLLPLHLVWDLIWLGFWGFGVVEVVRVVEVARLVEVARVVEVVGELKVS